MIVAIQQTDSALHTTYHNQFTNTPTGIPQMNVCECERWNTSKPIAMNQQQITNSNTQKHYIIINK